MQSMATTRTNRKSNTVLLSNMKLVRTEINNVFFFVQFVAHEKCQAQVSEIWFKGLQAMRYLNRFQYLLLSIPIGMVLLPILSVVYIVAPWSKVSK